MIVKLENFNTYYKLSGHMKNYSKRHFCKSIAYSFLALNFIPSISLANSSNNEVMGQSLEINGKVIKGLIDNIKSANIKSRDNQSILKLKNDIYLISKNSELEFKDNKIFRIIKGAVHSVFGKQRNELNIRTTNGTIGIRGTSTYIEIEEKFSRTYVCNCYGQTNIYDKNNSLKKEIKSKYHSPAIITGDGNVGASPYNIPLNHYDDHIEELNNLVGRFPNWKLPEGKKIFISPNNLKI